MDIHVSVVLATLDRAKLLDGALRALAHQHVPADLAYEVVVVDNGSRDATSEVVAAVAATSGAPIRLVREARRGLSNARNRGVEAARGEIIAFTDDDVLPPPDWVAAIAAGMERWQADGIGGRILPAWQAPPPGWLLADRRLLDRLAIMEAPEAAVLTVPIRGLGKVWGANMAFRRGVFETIGGFDPRLGVTGRRLTRGEESDLVLRALAHGLRIVYEPEIVVEHRIPVERMQRSYFRRLSFDAGRSDARVANLDGQRTFLGAPLGLYGMPRHIARWLWLAARNRPGAFREDLRWRQMLGQLTAHWRDALSPSDLADSVPMVVAGQPTDPAG